MIFNTKIYKRLTIGFSCLSLLCGCTKFENRSFLVDMPQSVINQAELDAYNNLKSYFKAENSPSFKLGSELSLSEISNNSLLYRLLQLHFNEIGITRDFNHIDFVQEDGKIVLDNFRKAVEQNKMTNMDTHVGHLLSHEKQQSTFLNGLIADIILPGVKGKDLVLDFENNKKGDTYPTNNSGASATIVADPEGKSGNALRILKTTGTAFPQLKITLPEGRVLGQCLNVIIDFKAGGSFGLYGAGMRLGVSSSYGDVTLKDYGSPSSFGNGDNIWGRGLIILPISKLDLTPEQKKLNTFILTLGSQTGSADYLIDNIQLDWEIKGETITKSAEEKKNIITAELDKWTKAVGEIGKDQVKSWSVLYQPMDETNPTQLRSGKDIAQKPANTFYWQDYLGKDYAAIAINMLKKYMNNSDQVFFTETNLIDNPAKIQGLLDFIVYTEKKGAKVDGIATEVSINIDADRTKIETMLQKLASTEKRIKISALEIGTGKKTAESNTELYQKQADMYQWFVSTYMKVIPLSQQAGITFSSPIDQASNAKWRPNEPLGIWSSTGGYIRKPTYQSIVKALENK